MIYYVIPPVVSTKGKCSQNIRIYEMTDPKTSAGFVHIYKNEHGLAKLTTEASVHGGVPLLLYTAHFRKLLGMVHSFSVR